MNSKSALYHLRATLSIPCFSALLLLSIPAPGRADSATWTAAGDGTTWESDSNWSAPYPATNPDIATFGDNANTSVSLSSDGLSVGGIVFSGTAASYTIGIESAGADIGFEIDASGVVNQSGVGGTGSVNQIFNVGGNDTFTAGLTFNASDAGTNINYNSNPNGTITFSNGSSADAASITNNGGDADGVSGGYTYFYDLSEAAGATIVNNGGTVADANGAALGSTTVFSGTATAANANITNYAATVSYDDGQGTINVAGSGQTHFTGFSTSGSATITNVGPSGQQLLDGAPAGETDYYDNARAGSATIYDNSGGDTQFFDNSTADNATINVQASASASGLVIFRDNSTAGNATIDSQDGGLIIFTGTSRAGNATISVSGPGALMLFEQESDGGTASLTANGAGGVDFSALGAASVHAGSIAGSGYFALGSKTLIVGGNDQDSQVTGVVRDGGIFGGAGASLVKEGTGALTLSGQNGYTGSTTVNGGKLIVNGDISGSSGVSVSAAGELGGSGSVPAISGAGLVAPGGASILTAPQVDPSGGLSFTFAFTQPGSPTYSASAASGNDLIHLTGATPFAFALTTSNTITVDFSGATLVPGQLYRGGFFTDAGAEDPMISGATFQYTGLGGASVVYQGMVPEASADFAGGTVSNGYLMQFVVVPEPSTLAEVVLGAGALLVWRKRRGVLRLRS